MDKDKLTPEEQFYIDEQIYFTKELNNKSDNQILKFHVEQKKNRDDILTEIAKVILSYSVVKEVMNIKDSDKKNLEAKLVNMVNEKIQSELNNETKLTGELLKFIGKDRYSINNYIYSLGAEDKKEPNNKIKIKSSENKIPNQTASRTKEEKNIITNTTRVDNIEANTLDDIINRKVDEKLWNDRLWTNKNETAKDLRTEIKDFLNGKTTVNEIENKIKKKYNTNGNETKRLVQDNVARVQEGVNDAWREEHSIKHVLYMATLCGNTCADCRQYDGKSYEVTKKPVTLPQHCFCRCTYVNIPNADWHPKMRLDNETKKNVNWQSYQEWANGPGAEYIKMKRKSGNIGEFAKLEEPMQLKHIKAICKEAKIDLEGIKIKIQRDKSLIDLPFFASADPKDIGRIDLFPSAFKNRDELLRTIVHEKVHVEQYKKYGGQCVMENRNKFEEEAYKLEEKWYNEYKKKG